MSRRRPRGLRPEERELWQRIAATAQPLHPAPAAAEKDEADGDASAPQAATTRMPLRHEKSVLPPALPELRPGSAAKPGPLYRLDLAPGPAEMLAEAPVRMDRNAHRKMTRGRLEPEARIDLHGMTLAEAHPELIRFILNAQDAGRRLVLVITGKGSRGGRDEGPIPQRAGVLRHQVPQWLRMQPLGPMVLQVAQAHLKHGGGGAYYVYLRRR